MNPSREVTDEDALAVPLRVDHVTADPEGPAHTVYCTDIEGTELRLALEELPAADLPLETDEWYQFDGVVRSHSPTADLLLAAGDETVERIDAPEPQTHPPLSELEEPWVIQLGASNEVVAVTVQPRPRNGIASIKPADPETFEIGAVCFAYCDGSGETTIYHREEPNARDERLLLQHVVGDLSEVAGATLVTNGSTGLALKMLRSRLALAAGGDVVAAGAEQVVDECFHATVESVAVRTGVDTDREAVQQLGAEAGPVLLSDYDIGSDPTDWREDWESDSMPFSERSDPRMADRDYTTLLEQYLRSEDKSGDSAQLAQCLKAYASADLSPLRELVTQGAVEQLACSRLAGGVSHQNNSV
jgi:hypothetical protein